MLLIGRRLDLRFTLGEVFSNLVKIHADTLSEVFSSLVRLYSDCFSVWFLGYMTIGYGLLRDARAIRIHFVDERSLRIKESTVFDGTP